MDKFNSIRPYNDEEVNNVLIDLSNNRRFLKMLFTTGKFDHVRYLPFSRKILSHLLKKRIKDIDSIKKYQNIFEGVVEDVVKKSITNYNLENFDAITFWHSLEHVYKINNLLETLSKNLKKNTHIFVAIPNFMSYDANKYQRDRAKAYPSIEEQLDDLYHNGVEGWKKTIKAIKDKYPKG